MDFIENEFPKELEYVWDWYLEVRGEHQLTNQEMLAWTQLSGYIPTDNERRLIFLLDSNYWRIAYEHQKRMMEANRKKK